MASKIIGIALLLFSINTAFAQADFEKKIQTQMIVAKDGSTIEITEGAFQMTKSLSLEGKKNIILRGKGMDKTILNFKNQTSGAEGIRVTDCENITIEDMTVQNSKGDLIKTLHVKGITFRRVKAEWTGTPSEKNGAYALYPVQCEDVLIENCTARGASDAGIYVGQSKKIVVKNCLAIENVAGIEIENSLDADVFDNVATGNTGGILVFDLPDLVQKKGGHVRVFKNMIKENNLANFAPKGNIVGKVPLGTGVLILATNHVEVFDNQIINNKSSGLGIISYYMTENPIKDKEYYPYPTAIYVHDNTFERRHERATTKGRFGQIFRFKLKFGKDVPHILYDGIVDPNTKDASGKIKPENRICIRNNKNQTVANMDAGNGFKNISKDLSLFDCEIK
jgi:parallel beta-helix repeat protein